MRTTYASGDLMRPDVFCIISDVDLPGAHRSIECIRYIPEYSFFFVFWKIRVFL